jgi:hypothetical protein
MLHFYSPLPFQNKKSFSSSYIIFILPMWGLDIILTELLF